MLNECFFVIFSAFHEQDLEEYGGWMGQRDHTVPQCVRRQPGDALLPLAALPQLPALRPSPAPHPAQHDEEGLFTVSATILIKPPAKYACCFVSCVFVQKLFQLSSEFLCKHTYKSKYSSLFFFFFNDFTLNHNISVMMLSSFSLKHVHL